LQRRRGRLIIDRRRREPGEHRMAVCSSCKKKQSGRLAARLAVPEYRAMTGYWPWVEVQVCGDCVAGHDRDFRERLGLLAPQVIENDEPIVERVCVACGAIEPGKEWPESAKWIGADGRPVRRARFFLCDEHRAAPYVDGIVVSTNLVDTAAVAAVVAELPTVTGDILARVEGWRPDGAGAPAAGADVQSSPPGSTDFTPDRRPAEAVAAAMEFWKEAPAGLDARAAWLGPVRKDYRLRYRLDLVRDYKDGRCETFTIVRTAPDRLATYRTVRPAPSI